MAKGQKVKGVFAKARRAPRRLSLADVVSVGLPAVYQQFGEQLLYVDGTIFDASDPSLPAEILNVADESDEAVGLEFGWQHAGENLTAPPYPIPLRGIQVKIRAFEPDSRQVREVTVVQDFLPQ